MPNNPLSIWCNARFPDPVMEILRKGTAGHRLIIAQSAKESNLIVGTPDPALAECDVAFGQPSAAQVAEVARLKWVHLTTAGYDRYDTPAVRQALGDRHGMLTNSSPVYAEPCAQHGLAMMLAQARRLDWAITDQAGDRPWSYLPIRRASNLIMGQTVLMLGFGMIGKRLAELLAPFNLRLIAARRNASGPEGAVEIIPTTQIDARLAEADHVINILPGGSATERFMNAAKFSAMKPGSIFYNLGRGSTVDQPALIAALQSGHLGAAWLDVTVPEPLPPNDPLWQAPRCHITPHTAGGHATEFHRLTEHFLNNLQRYTSGRELVGRVI